MSFVLVILGSMFLLDIFWLWLSFRLVKSRGWRWFFLLFLLLQMGGLLWLILNRIYDLNWPLPGLFASFLYIWHFPGLVLCLVLTVIVTIAWMARGVRHFFSSRRPHSAPITANPGESPEMTPLSRRQFLGIITAATPPILTLGLTGIARHQTATFRIQPMTIHFPGLPAQLDGVTIAHVSDMHVGRFTTGRVVEEMVDAVNHLEADLVLLTGDLINDELVYLDEAMEAVGRMSSLSGRWIIEGNHDLIEDGEEFRNRIRAADIGFLHGESAEFTLRNTPVQILGLPWVSRHVTDYEKANAEAVRSFARNLDPEAFSILLAHHPHAFDTAVELGIPLTLAGHTHGGQLMLNEQRGFGPMMFRYWSGLYTRGNSRLVVSNGTGNWFPLRVNAPAEIIHITLRRTKTENI